MFWQTEFLPVTCHDWLDVLCCVLTNWDLPSYTWWLTGRWKQLWPKIGRQQMYANNTGIMTVGLHLEWTGLWEHPPCFSLLCCDVTWNAIFCGYCEEKHGIIMLPFSYIALWSFCRFVLTQHGEHWWLCPLAWFVRFFWRACTRFLDCTNPLPTFPFLPWMNC